MTTFLSVAHAVGPMIWGNGPLENTESQVNLHL